MPTLEEQIAKIRSEMTPEQRARNKKRIEGMIAEVPASEMPKSVESAASEIATPPTSTMTGRHLKQVDDAVSAAISGKKRKSSQLATPGD